MMKIIYFSSSQNRTVGICSHSYLPYLCSFNHCFEPVKDHVNFSTAKEKSK